MLKRSSAFLAGMAALALPLSAQARDVGGIDVSATLKNETAVFAKGGTLTGGARTTLDDHKHDAGDILKFENSARLFFNGDMGDSTSWHGELNLIYDTAGVNGAYKGNRWYTQHDYLREFYIDTSLGSWDFRIGKQQVVWGTADGIKLLDIINPTDYRELNQNTFEDSRIPVWMFNAESNVGERGNVQFILSGAESNKYPGLWTMDSGDSRFTAVINNASPTGYSFAGNGRIRGRDRGQAFIAKGVDVITGGVNGFFNIGAAFGSVTNTFAGGTIPGSPNFINPFGGFNPGMPEFATVAGFTGASFQQDCQTPGGPISGASCLELFTEITNADVTNLIDVDKVAPGTGIPLPNGTWISTTGAGWNISSPNSAWEYFPNATFATFNAYVGMNTLWKRKYNDNFWPSDANIGGRYRTYFDNGLNLSVNYFYAYDPNPSVNIRWRDPRTGQRLDVDKFDTVAGTQVLQIRNPKTGAIYGANNVSYTPSNYVGAVPTNVVSGVNNGGPATLVFEEDRNRIHNIGSSFDYAFDVGVPVVLRGEFLYQKDVNQPVINRYALANGDLAGGLKSEKQDFFKYVIGADVTVFTNLLVSGQFIQFRNLDFVNKSRTCMTQDPQQTTVNCSRYTGDPASLNLTTGLRKGYKNKEFYSLFLSKPFGESQLGRWNNILIYEEGDGWWNRFDMEYSFTDQLVVGGELNMYWGNEDRTLFGQFKNSSNLQLSVKYIID